MFSSLQVSCMEGAVFLTNPFRHRALSALSRVGFAAIVGLATKFRPLPSSALQYACCTGIGGSGNCTTYPVTYPCSGADCGNSCRPQGGYCPTGAYCWTGSVDCVCDGTCCDCLCYSNQDGMPLWCY